MELASGDEWRWQVEMNVDGEWGWRVEEASGGDQ